LDRVKHSLHVEAYRPEVPGPWWWRLATNIATNIAKVPEDGELGDLGNHAKNTGDSANFDTDNDQERQVE
jgi:hypothetical protein